SVDWLGRVRAYEDFARQQGLTFNLIVNSERGGQQSDDLFCRETLQMVDAYLKSGGRPTRWFVQSWYPYPKQMTPETAPHTMTALVKAAIERVSDGAAPSTRREAPARPAAARGAETLPQTHASTGTAQGRIVLQPQAGAMQVRAQVPRLDNQAFALGIDNLDRCCLHAAPNFGDIGPGEGSTTVSRSYLAKGTRDDFLQRLAADRPGLSARQKWARPVGAAHGSKPARADGGDSQGASGHGPSVGSGSAESGRIITKLRVSETTSLATQREASDEHTPIPGSARSVTIHGGARIERKRRQVAALQNAAVGQREPASHVAVRQTGTLGRRKRLVGLLKASNTVAQGGAAYPGLT
nr:hypothetical protein [Pirellulaceae bacterium]